MIDIEHTQHWELWIWLGIAVSFGVLLLISVAQEVLADRRKWRRVPRHIGSVYDATVHTEPRPNIRRA